MNGQADEDEMVPLAVLARELPRRRRGRPTHVSTLHRWRTRGRLGVRLETVLVGGIWCSRRRDLREFLAAVTLRAQSPATPRIGPSGSRELEAQLSAEGW